MSKQCKMEMEPHQPTEREQISADELLRNTVDLNHGFMEKLCSIGVIDERYMRHCYAIVYAECREDSHEYRSIFEYILRLYYDSSNEIKQKFLSALETTRQSHVANYIRNNGQRPTIYPDNWPIYGSTEWRRIETNWSCLLDLIDGENGLLDELQSVECITKRHREAIEGAVRNSNSAKNRRLLICIQQGSFADYKKFVNCLERTKQYLAASLLNPDGVQCQPLAELQRGRFETHYPYLLEFLDTRGGLLTELFARQCITRRQMEYIESASSRQELIRRLIDAIVRGSQPDFDKFVYCLNKSGQQHVSSLLHSDGTISSVVAFTNSSLEEENTVVERFLDLLKNTSPRHRAELFEKLDTLKNELEGNWLTSMQTHHSIKLFFLSKSLISLRNLYELYSNEQLKAVIQDLFTELLERRRIVTVVKLSWNMSEFLTAAKYLSAKDNLSIHCQMYQLLTSEQYAHEAFSSQSYVNLMELIPHELFEGLLMKAVGQLFGTYSKLTNLAEVFTFVTLCSVSLYWWETIADMHVRDKWKRFNRYFAPHARPITLIEDRITRGVAEYDNKLYVVSTMSNLIKVHDLSLPGSQFDDILVPSAVGLRDIVVCGWNHCLYAADPFRLGCKGPCIWKISLSGDNKLKATKFVETKYLPWKLSVLDGEMLVTPFEESMNLDVYSDDSQLIKTIQLPKGIFADHAVQTSQKTVVVCHKAGIAEISADGKVLRALQRPMNFTLSSYLVQDDNGNIFVADHTSKRVLRLNSKLELQQVLQIQLKEEPIQLCYSHRTGKLFTCYCNSPRITVHRIAEWRT